MSSIVQPLTFQSNPSDKPAERVATHDGYIYPVPRHEMRDRDAILHRMVDDMDILERTRGGITLERLNALGWPAETCAIYAAPLSVLAISIRTDKRAAIREALRIAGEFICLGVFLLFIALLVPVAGA